ncbi:MAG: ATP-binding protein [Verrucomicrobiota bacterium]|nr:ATP-binding protein [Verrucomicrobiota bacterium]
MNPFVYGAAVSGRNFCPRPKLNKKLKGLIISGQNVLVHGERRTGKTSLVYETCQKLRNKYSMIYIDFNEIIEIETFYRKLLYALMDIEEKNKSFMQMITKGLKSLRPTVSYDYINNTPTISFKALDDNKNNVESIEEAIELIGTVANRHKLIVVFDEFQNILKMKNSSIVLAALRSRIQFQTDIPYIFAGSIRNDMDEIFHNPESPFFKSAMTLTVEEIPESLFFKFIEEKFAISNRRIERDLFRKIEDLTDGIPGDIQQLCKALWNNSNNNDTITETHIQLAIKDISREFLKTWQNYINMLTPHQIKILKGLAYFDGQHVNSIDFLNYTGIKQPSSVTRGIKKLEKLRLVFRNGNYKFTDPFFKKWILTI